MDLPVTIVLLCLRGIEGAQLIWSMWLEEEHAEGNGLRENGGDRRSDDFQIDNIKPKSTQGGTSTEYTMQRMIRDANDEGAAPERRSQLQLGLRPKLLSWYPCWPR